MDLTKYGSELKLFYGMFLIISIISLFLFKNYVFWFPYGLSKVLDALYQVRVLHENNKKGIDETRYFWNCIFVFLFSIPFLEGMIFNFFVALIILPGFLASIYLVISQVKDVKYESKVIEYSMKRNIEEFHKLKKWKKKNNFFISLDMKNRCNILLKEE